MLGLVAGGVLLFKGVNTLEVVLHASKIAIRKFSIP